MTPDRAFLPASQVFPPAGPGRNDGSGEKAGSLVSRLEYRHSLGIEADKVLGHKPVSAMSDRAAGKVFTWLENFQSGFDGWSSLLSRVLRIVAMRSGGRCKYHRTS